MTWYREISPAQEPFDFGLDASGRARMAFNVEIVKRYSSTFLEEIIKILEDAGVGTYETDIFATTKADIPTGDGPYLVVVATPGSPEERTQNSVSVPAYPRPSAQISVRATDMEDVETMVWAAYDALVGIRNTDITP